MSGRRVVVTGIGGELGSRVGALLEEQTWVGEIVGIDANPPRRRLRRTVVHVVEPQQHELIAERIVQANPHVIGVATSMLIFINSFGLLLAIRSLQALGAQCVMGLSIGLMTTMFGDNNRGAAVGLNTAVGAFGVLFVPLSIGLLAENGNWRLFFIFPTLLSLISIMLLRRINIGTEQATISKVEHLFNTVLAGKFFYKICLWINVKFPGTLN